MGPTFIKSSIFGGSAISLSSPSPFGLTNVVFPAHFAKTTKLEFTVGLNTQHNNHINNPKRTYFVCLFDLVTWLKSGQLKLTARQHLIPSTPRGGCNTCNSSAVSPSLSLSLCVSLSLSVSHHTCQAVPVSPRPLQTFQLDQQIWKSPPLASLLANTFSVTHSTAPYTVSMRSQRFPFSSSLALPLGLPPPAEDWIVLRT